MKINIKVMYINALQGEEGECCRFSCEGELYKKADKTFLKYTEPKGNGGGKVILRAEKNVVTMNRQADAVSSFRFEKGKTHLSRYFTPYGTFLTSVTTNTLTVRLSEADGKIEMGYSLTVADDSLSSPSVEKMENKFGISYFAIENKNKKEEKNV